MSFTRLLATFFGDIFMTDKSSEFIEQLTHADNISPALRASYQAELDAMLHPKHTRRTMLPGIGLLVVLVVGLLALAHNILFVPAGPIALTGWAILAAAFAYAAFLIIRDLREGTHSPKSVFSISKAIGGAAGMLTAVALTIGSQHPSDPASTFHALYVFVFFVACISWNIDGRIAAAELAAREQMLRIECRLADLCERFNKG
jgi:hypothetical protein